MATGRGWILQQHTEHLPKSKPGSSSFRSCPVPSLERQPIKKKMCNKNSTNVYAFRNRCIPHVMSSRKLYDTQSSHILSMPYDVLLKILSYLDPISLISVGCVNKQFYELSNDNVLWYKFYTRSAKKTTRWKNDSISVLQDKLADSTITEKESGYWKQNFIRELIAVREHRLIQILKAANNYSRSGVPANMGKAVRMSGLMWVLTFKDVDGKETVINQTSVTFRDMCLMVFWNSYTWPALHSLTMLQLHGVTPLQIDKCLQFPKNRLRRLSLIAEYDMKDFKKRRRYIGEDSQIKLFCLDPCLIIGLWKRNPDLAFVMAGLHYHQLLEKSFWGTSRSPYIFTPKVPLLDDIDPEYGLHGYQLHIDMHNGRNTFLSRTFRGLFCRKEYIRRGFLRMTAIGIRNNRDHAPLVGKVNFLWKTLTFSGSIQNSLMMDVTLLDESEAPYWCFSAPVQLRECELSETLYNFMGQSFHLEYSDSIGKVSAQLNWMKETEEHFIINLVLYLNTEQVNNHFGTNYTDAPN